MLVIMLELNAEVFVMENKPKILIVDDEENICELVRLYIEKEGFDAIIANDGQEAVANLIRRNRI